MTQNSPLPKNVLDLTGHKYGKLTVLRFSHCKRYGKGHTGCGVAHWVCVCDCGKETLASGNGLRTGHKKSCGCIKKGRVSPARKAFGVAAKYNMYGRYRTSAETRGIEFNLDLETFYAIGSGPCHYCGLPPKPYDNSGKNYGFVLFSGVDRKDPKMGYIEDNCVACCSTCNYAKQGMTYDEFLSWSKRLSDHLFRAG